MINLIIDHTDNDRCYEMLMIIHDQCWSFSHHQQGRIDFNTVMSTGKDFLITVERLMVRECPCSTKTREISRVSGNLSDVGDGFPNTSLVLVLHGYNASYREPYVGPLRSLPACFSESEPSSGKGCGICVQPVRQITPHGPTCDENDIFSCQFFYTQTPTDLWWVFRRGQIHFISSKPICSCLLWFSAENLISSKSRIRKIVLNSSSADFDVFDWWEIKSMNVAQKQIQRPLPYSPSMWP